VEELEEQVRKAYVHTYVVRRPVGSYIFLKKEVPPPRPGLQKK